MPMRRINLLQLGDLHLPTAAALPRNIDDKDKSFSIELKNKISTSPLKQVLKQCHELIATGQVDAVLHMGDLTDRGDQSGYRAGIEFLSMALQIGNGKKYENLPIGVVPGNHDISRVLAGSPGMNEKFHPLERALLDNGIENFPYNRCTQIQISGAEDCLTLNLMNSCWGCGAKENIPEAFRDAIATAIDAVLAKTGTTGLDSYYDRQLDTPAFSDATIQHINQIFQTTSANHLHVFIAHHNFLPQRLARVAPYTELVNSGALRAALLEANRPSIYLHGHIHDDPIEILKLPAGHNVVSISAPELSNGFNNVELIFSELGMPLACKITPWRFNKTGHLVRQDQETISLTSRKRRIKIHSSDSILSGLMTKSPVYWSELVELSLSLSHPLSEDKLHEEVEILLAEQLITIENYQSDPKHWIVGFAL